jgi:hypothetical protein
VSSRPRPASGSKRRDRAGPCDHPCPPLPLMSLRKLKRQQAEALLQVGFGQTGETLVCCREDGRGAAADLPHPSSTYLMGVAGAAAAAVRDLRHSHATRLLVEDIHPARSRRTGRRGSTWRSALL